MARFGAIPPSTDLAAGQSLRRNAANNAFEAFTPGAGAGDMTKATYDPQTIEGDAFARANHTGSQAISTVTNLQSGLDAKAALVSTGATVVHGSTASTARPSGYTAVTWIGSVEPTNATNDDIWVSTAAAPSTAANPYSFAARKSGSTQALSASTFTKVTLETVESDDNGDFSNSRYTATVAGKYTFTWRVGITTTTRLFSTLYKNGAEVWRGTDADTSRASSGSIDSLALAVNDYVELYAWASTSVTMVSGVGNTNYLSGHLISETV
jgi:hypothetical protein